MTSEEYDEFFELVLELPLKYTDPEVDKVMRNIFEWLSKHIRITSDHIDIDKDGKVYSIN